MSGPVVSYAIICMNKKIVSSGFTLIELMVVMVLLGMLSILALSMFQGSQKRTRDVRRKSDLVQMTKALEMYFADKSGYPASTGGNIMGCGADVNPVACVWGSPWARGTATYMQTLPMDPTGGIYCYSLDTVSGKWYKLYAKLEKTDDSDYNASLTCGGNSYNYVLLSPNITPTPGQ